MSDSLGVTEFKPGFKGFDRLMQRKVHRILLVSSLYDKFLLDEDGRLSEMVVREYLDLNLSNPPIIRRASTGEEALQRLRDEAYDAVITMMRLGDMNPGVFGRAVKEIAPHVPVSLLAFNNHQIDEMLEYADLEGIDHTFIWTGDSRMLLTLVKLDEDRMNVDHDTHTGGVRVIVLVEDSPHFYSSYLPLLYGEMLEQTQRVMSDSLNDPQRVLRMRARPKILHAATYEDAIELCRKHRKYLLALITDVTFPREGKKEAFAGIKLATEVREMLPNLAILVQSSDKENESRAHDIDASFLHKFDPRLLEGIREFMLDNLGFGDFIFRNDEGVEIARASSVHEMERVLRWIPAESVLFHASSDHFSTWLQARTEFQLAEAVLRKKVTHFDGVEEVREYLVRQFSDLQNRAHSGEIVEFHPDVVGKAQFSRIGSGSLGGKARGLGFMNALLWRNHLSDHYPGVRIQVPTAVVIAADMFERFMHDNSLWEIALSDASDAEKAEAFLRGHLPPEIVSSLSALVGTVDVPLAVRSSSLLEDAMYNPFAGIYGTKMLPNNQDDAEYRYQKLTEAVKMVYASTYFRRATGYIAGNTHLQEEERMAVLIQQVVGRQHANRFYPVVSGVARGYNFYPTGKADPMDGVVNLALGMGKTIVEGDRNWTYSPAWPAEPPPFTSVQALLNNTQTEFWAIDMSGEEKSQPQDEDEFLIKSGLTDAEEDDVLDWIASTYDPASDRIYGGTGREGPRVVNFAPLLEFERIPLNRILKDLLKMCEDAFGCKVEIEFALSFPKDRKERVEFGFLQVRPLVVFDAVEIELGEMKREELLLASTRTLGNGELDQIHDVIYIPPEKFDAAKTRDIAAEIEKLNQPLAADGREYLLIGFGRWGSSDPWLGIPVDWSQICGAKVIVETSLDRMQPDPSQGSHFFHNLTSHQVTYMSVRHTDPFPVDWEWLEAQDVVAETTHCRHVHLKAPLKILADGRSGNGAVLLPE